MPPMSLKVIEIFKPGTHIARDGKAYAFTEADLQACAAAYDPAKHEAPICVGHPKSDAPAYGWAGTLTVTDGALAIQPTQVDPAFAEMVNEGRFKKRSAKFYAPDDPANPVPGTWYLRHVAFLGAQAPAVKGLKDVSFADDDSSTVEFVESMPSRWWYMDVASMFRRVRDHFIDTLGLEQADKVMPEYTVKQLEDQAAKLDSNLANSYSETEIDPPEDVMTAEERAEFERLKADNAAFKTKEAEFSEREKKITAVELQQKRDEVTAFVEGAIKEGKILPRDKAGMIEFMCSLDGSVEIEFSEGETTVKKSGKEYLQGYISAMPNLVEFEEITKDDNKNPLNKNDANAIAKAAIEFAEAEEKAGRDRPSASAAVDHVVKQQAAQ